MKHLKSYELFEAIGQSSAYLATTVEDLTNYYSCPVCNALFKTFNQEVDLCPHCGNYDSLNSVSDFEYMTLVKQRLDKNDFEKEIKDKRKREEEYVDLLGLSALKEIKRRKSNIN